MRHLISYHHDPQRCQLTLFFHLLVLSIYKFAHSYQLSVHGSLERYLIGKQLH